MKALLAVLCLAAVCWGALGQNTAAMPDPTPAPIPSVSDVPTTADFNQVGMQAMFNDVISARTADELNDVYNPANGTGGVSRFDNSLSSGIRRSYYYNCVRKNENGTVTFPTSEQLMGNVFSIYFQMPVLLYLNFEVRRGMMAALENVTMSDNLCIYQHQDFRVSYFEEGVLVSFFDSATVNGTESLDGMTLLNNFRNRSGDMYGFTSFLGKSALNLGYPGLYTDGVVPAVVATRSGDDAGFAVNPSDVRRHALIIYDTVGAPNLADIESTIMNNAAANPNAINYYLEAGDYVFIVIGSILTFSVLVLTVIGFAIHPYFLG